MLRIDIFFKRYLDYLLFPSDPGFQDLNTDPELVSIVQSARDISDFSHHSIVDDLAVQSEAAADKDRGGRW